MIIRPVTAVAHVPLGRKIFRPYLAEIHITSKAHQYAGKLIETVSIPSNRVKYSGSPIFQQNKFNRLRGKKV
jgi:hypothetical protein